MGRHTIEELYQWQALPLNVKVNMTKARIRDWVEAFWEDGVYVSFSGGKDSTVLLDLVRQEYPGVTAVFVDTGLEYPEIREFVKTFDNVEWVRPKMNFRQVIEKYGYPFISKEVSQTIYEVKRSIANGTTPASYRLKKLNGEVRVPGTGELSTYNIPQWKFMLDAPFVVSHMCCSVIKKGPAKAYEKRTGRKPITAQMAEESFLRKQRWLQSGCNAFDNKRPISNPMAFWTEQDVLSYIKKNHLPICSVYGDIVEADNVNGQMTIADYDGVGEYAPILETTGARRTGCMFCGYGCHLEKGEGRFERMKRTHPKQYDYIMRPKEQGGLDYKNVIDWINEHGNLHIRY